MTGALFSVAAALIVYWLKRKLKKAENEIGHAQTEKQEDKAGKETIIWLDGENGNPLGVIVKKNKTKRAKKSPKK